jgi:DNA polymerase V
MPASGPAPLPPDLSSDSAGDRSGHALVASAVRRARRGPSRARPLFLSRVSAGFPSPADDFVEATLDLNEHLVRREASTFFVRVSGSSMTGVGIHDEDVLVVDRAVEPEDGSVVVAALDGELTVKRYCVRKGRPCLVPESEAHDPIPIEPGQELIVWGVVQHVIHEVS